MIYLTEYLDNGVLMCGENVHADSWEEAEKKTSNKVIGVLIEEIPCSELLVEFCRSFN